MKQKTTQEIPEQEELQSYHMMIKRRLVKWRAAFEKSMGASLNYEGIASLMTEKFGLQTSPQKIAAMFDLTKTREVKLAELVALCQIYDIPLVDLCSFPGTLSSGMDIGRTLRRGKGTPSANHPLSNRYYQGEYYAYYLRPKHYEDHLKPVEQNELEEARLTIAIEEGRTVVTLQEMKSQTSFYRKPMPAFTLTGNLYVFENTDIAYCFLSEGTGRRAMALMFQFLNLSADVRYYMTVGMMTFSLNQVHQPLFQKMAVFRQRQDKDSPEGQQVLRGILALDNGSILLDEQTIRRLMEEDENMRALLVPDRALTQCSLFSETALRSAMPSLENRDRKTDTILRLKSQSLNPAHEIVSETDAFAGFIKRYQQRQMEQETQK